MSTTLFGTDGIRGVANRHPVTAEVAMKLGRAVACVFKEKGRRADFVIGKDTRLSGYMLECAITSGIISMGANVSLVGPMPTPAVAHLTRTLRAAAGIVISASHNPFEDNGIKVFQGNGYKCEDSIEKRLEELILSDELEKQRPIGGEIGRALRIEKADARYAEMAKASFPHGLDLFGIKVAVDCANGAAYKTTPEVLSELGADLVIRHDKPDGLNINLNCGSTHPEVIQQLVKEKACHIGIAHDGDADRLICCDENGEIVDGDEILAIIGLDYLRRGKLTQNTLVATVMSNYGLDDCFNRVGAKVIRTKVGDRYVIEEMLAGNLNLGGEQSGHIIVRDHTTTGDGLVTALQLLRIMKETGKPLSELKRCLDKYPQLLVNVKVKERKPIDEIPSVRKELAAVEKELKGTGRVMLRYSGTEPKIRLLLEAKDQSKIQAMADRILSPLREAIGA